MHEPLADLIEKVNEVSDVSSGTEFLSLSQKLFEAKHIAYLCLNLPNPTHDDYYIHHSYSTEWEQCYESEQFVAIDPVLSNGLASITPTDWADLQHQDSAINRFFGVARELDVGKQGLTFTVRGGRGETAIFSINTDHNPVEWQSYKAAHMSDLQVIATYFHEKILQSQAGFREVGLESLSGRELECLKWCTAGKSYWETSVILGISERTVNFHMTTVRHKLNAMTNAQAVAKAVIQGLTSPG